MESESDIEEARKPARKAGSKRKPKVAEVSFQGKYADFNVLSLRSLMMRFILRSSSLHNARRRLQCSMNHPINLRVGVAVLIKKMMNSSLEMMLSFGLYVS